jgi:DDE superfamily endonuclease
MRRISMDRSETLHRAYLDDIRQFVTEDLIFLDESIFNEKTGWRHHAYAPIGDEARYDADIQRGRTWSICAAMALNGWLPCTGRKDGYFSSDDFFE